MTGKGIIKGMAETARNFFGSYVDKERLVTVQYPEEKIPAKQATRNFPFLVYDGGDWEKGLRCVACQICEKECPPQCIYILKDAVKKPDAAGKLQFQAKTFDIDISVCMSCQICVEVCPFDAIKMDIDYEFSSSDRFDPFLLRKKDLAKANAYYHKIHSDEATEVDARLAAERTKAQIKSIAAAEKKPAAPVTPKPLSPVT